MPLRTPAEPRLRGLFIPPTATFVNEHGPPPNQAARQDFGPRRPRGSRGCSGVSRFSNGPCSEL